MKVRDNNIVDFRNLVKHYDQAKTVDGTPFNFCDDEIFGMMGLSCDNSVGILKSNKWESV